MRTKGENENTSWLLLGSLLLGCGAPPAAATPLSSLPAASPSAQAVANVVRQPPPVENAPRVDVSTRRDSVIYVFPDPERKIRLTKGVSDLDAWLEQRGHELNAAGLFVGVVVDDELVASASYGYRSAPEGARVDQDSVFRIGSITKPVTAMAVLGLRDAGKLQLDAPVASYLPEMAQVQALTRDSAPLTIRHLLTHTSGLPREAATADDTGGKGTSESSILASLAGIQLEFEPGSRYQYSNLGFTLLGSVIARVSGMPYRQYVQEHVFTPLGLTSATWDAASVPPGRLALPHKLDDHKVFQIDPKEEVFGAREAGGGLYISGRDFGRFLAWQLGAQPAGQDSEEVGLVRASRREAQQPGRFTGFNVQPARAGAPWVANAEASAVGLSWHGYSNCDFDYVVFHNGLVHTYATDAAFLPRFGVGVFAFANSTADVGRLRRELLEKLKLTGALAAREQRPLETARLEQALAQLLDVYGTWDEHKYQAMLSEGHKQKITQAREQQELDEYRQLHGACRSARMLHYTSQNAARYLLDCERARLEMALYLNPLSGLIDGFIGYSSGVQAPPEVARAAKRALELLNVWNQRAFERLLAPKADAGSGTRALSDQVQAFGPCSLGELLERDGNRWHRFRVTCKSGPARILGVHLDDADRTRIDGLTLAPVSGGPCAEK
ncbi:MAG TPA: serine hydrolase domain-containing protein [Polyangiaceae bacterium]|nr:serine hydrolase domain-containing protein [Polyangiaceae bacterium]